ncbi:dienelactone hydrolase [Pelomonas sp. SE-A7]|uniref:alpha/beta hydrolase family protein n=1 Tax=Pelomonas sp. SE-A7 TaxID=3054953 RepID=UPI00259D219B|nr:dienelactone hydrolase [Pelomonas sp. SE-A7]MDM4768518.1 dienelactone hydrolase [Pelomonas sp. SE-A7]
MGFKRGMAGLLLGLWACVSAQAGVAVTELRSQPDEAEPVTVFYPTELAGQPERRLFGSFRIAVDAPPRPGNGRLVVVSHGSGGSPWVHFTLIRALVEAGYVVAAPRHRADNSWDDGRPGPDSWTLRPAEVSRAIDAVAADARFGPRVDLQNVGVFGMSAGGHTALSVAGGRWSPALFSRHCDGHLAEDFNACVGLATRLTGGWADGLKKWIATRVLRFKFADDGELRQHSDRRIKAVVAAVPAAADFDPGSLTRPTAALALVTARQDRWLHPQFHSDRILAACLPRCEHLADLAAGGHGAYLSPLPPGLSGLLGELINDPPGFDRAAELPAVEARIVDFFERHLRVAGRSSAPDRG